jgi:hypothetical protein
MPAEAAEGRFVRSEAFDELVSGLEFPKLPPDAKHRKDRVFRPLLVELS